jgi:hypothetical protein
MPLVLLQYKKGRRLKKIAKHIAEHLPGIVAPYLNVEGRNRHDGGVTADEIIVRCTESNALDVNTADLEIVIFAHDFRERKATLEKRKDGIIKNIHILLRWHHRPDLSGFVWIILAPTAFGSLQNKKPQANPYRAVRQFERHFSPTF